MSLAEKLESLARRIPGVAGYQDQEASRETDKLVRDRIAATLDDASRALEKAKRQLASAKSYALLQQVDFAASRAAALANLIRHAVRGYSGLLDVRKVDQAKLDQIYASDLELVDDAEKLRDIAKSVDASPANESLSERIEALLVEIEKIEHLFSQRETILTT